MHVELLAHYITCSLINISYNYSYKNPLRITFSDKYTMYNTLYICINTLNLIHASVDDITELPPPHHLTEKGIFQVIVNFYFYFSQKLVVV